MTRECPVLAIEVAPGDPPRAVEQPNGDLLVPAAVRPLIEEALLQAEHALTAQGPEVGALSLATRLLGIERPDPRKALLRNLMKVRPI